MRDIVDDIDALVDEQLQQEPSGYDHNINQSQCWHCGRDFHGLPITERMEQMRREYHYTGNVEHLAEYRYAEDDSAILCLGSTAIGPARPGSRRWYFEEDAGLVSAAYVRHALGLSMPWIPDVANVRDAALALLRDGGLLQARSFPRPRWWRLDDPDPRLEIEVRTEFESGLDDYGRGEMYREAPRRWVLVLHDHATGGLEEVELYRSPGGDVYRVTFEDPQRPNRIIRVEIFAERPPRRGGAWVELDDNVEPASLPQHRSHEELRRQVELLTRPLASVAPAELLDLSGWTNIGYLDPEHAPQFVSDAPYLHVPEIRDGDVVGYEDISTGETVTGRATVQQDGDEWSITIGDPE